MSFLPAYLEEAGRYEDLISLLSPEHLELVFTEARALAPVQRSIECGIRTAKKTGNTADLLRFALTRSSLLEMTAFDVIASEVEAKIALEQHDAASSLANSAVLNGGQAAPSCDYFEAKETTWCFFGARATG